MFLLKILIEVILVVMAADFVSGLVHWWEDAYIRQSTPIIGSSVGKNNIIHHYLPRYFTRKNWWSSSYDLVILSVLGVVAAWHYHVLCWQVVLFAFITANANEVHKWSHRTPKENGRLITCGQKFGIFLTPRQHMIHHTNPKNSHYCPVTNLVNPILDYVNFWQGLELVIYKLTGIARKPDPSVTSRLIPDWVKGLN